MEMYFNMFKVRFTVLEDLMRNAKLNINNRVNVFINLEPILIYLTTPKVDEYLRVKNEEKIYQLIACIINLASHYRLFFNKLGISNKIYMYYQHPFICDPKNKTHNDEYRTYYRYKFDKNVTKFIISDCLNSATPLIKIILEYINGIYLIESGAIENSVIPAIISKNDPEATNFIVSNNIYDFQYVNRGFNIIYPRQENSRLLTASNVMEFICSRHNVTGVDISSNTLPFLLSIIGDKLRNIYGVKGLGMKRTLAMISKAVSAGLMTENTTSLELFLPILKPLYHDIVSRNYKCIDIGTQLSVLNSADEMYVAEQLVDKFDNMALKEINDKFFTENPLQLIELTGYPRGTKLTF